MNLFVARVASFQIEGTDTSSAPLIPSIHPSSPPSSCPSHLYASVLYFQWRNISQQWSPDHTAKDTTHQMVR